MRYIGQGHEIEVELPEEPLQRTDREILMNRFDKEYALQYTRTIPNMDIEILSWSLSLYVDSEETQSFIGSEAISTISICSSSASRNVYNFVNNTVETVPVYQRLNLEKGHVITGPVLLHETDTTIVVPEGFSDSMITQGHLLLEKKS